MTDFVTDLEHELAAAARRRRERRRRRRGLTLRRLPAARRLVPALAAVAVIAFAAVGLTAVTGGDPVRDDRGTGGPPVAPEEAFGLTLPLPGAFTACDAPARRQDSGEGPRELLGVLRRPAGRIPWKPDLRQGGDVLLPVTAYRDDEVRGRRSQGVDLLLVPAGGVLAAHCGEPLRRTAAPGACLVTRRRAFLATRCWTLETITARRAITMAAPRDWVVGVVPDGVGTVEVAPLGAKGAYLAVVEDNLFALKVPGARRGTRLEVTMRSSGGPRVAFLDGTDRAGAARAAQQRLRASGLRFRTAAIGSGPDQDLEVSRIYRTSRTGAAARDAVEVGGRLGIQDIYDATEDIRTLSPEAHVFVVVGADAPASGEGGGGYEPPPEHRGGGQ